MRAISIRSISMCSKADDWPEPAMKRRGTIYALTWGRDTSPETADRFAA